MKEFFTRDKTSKNVHYVDTLIHPGLYVIAFLLAIVLYLDYLYTDHFNTISEYIARIPDKANKIKEEVKAKKEQQDAAGEDNQELWGLGIYSCLAVAVLLILSVMSFKYYLKQKAMNNSGIDATEDLNASFSSDLRKPRIGSNRISQKEYTAQMKRTTSLELQKLMDSEEFAEMAKEKGLSKLALQRRHSSLFEKPPNSAISSRRSSPKGRK